MNILPPGSWEAFGRWSPNGAFIPEEVSEKVLLSLKKEQLREIGRDIREQYIRGFNQVTRLDTYQLETSLELVEMGLVDDRGRQCECHPGRFSLNPDAGTRAVGGNPGLLCEALPWGVRMTASYWRGRKHRKLSSSAEIWDSTFVVTGCQDVYFLGGLPLQYWSFGDQMGLKLPDKEMSEKTEWLSGNWMWRNKEDVALYQLTDGLLAFGELPKHWNYARFLMEKEQEMIDGNSFST